MRRNFTMVELLAAIAIIAILAGLGVGIYGLTMRRSKVARTEALLKRVEVACEQLKQKRGFYPPTMEGYVVRLDLRPAGTGSALDQELQNEFLNALGGDNLNQFRHRTKLNSTEVDILVDAWGNPLFYQSPGRRNRQSFDVASIGPDGKVNDQQFWKLTYDANGQLTKIEIPAKGEDDTLSALDMDTEKQDDIGNF